MSKQSMIILGSIIGVILLCIMSYINMHNSLVSLDENVNSAWAQVENQMQRRFDLIPNLVNTVKGYASHEKEIFTNIAESRAKLGGASTVKDKINASNSMEGALSRLLLVVENYPDLKANSNFTRLMDELAGSENRLSVERRRYNEHVKIFNKKIRTIPTNMVASRMGFERKEFFEVEETAKVVPTVSFK